MNNWYWEYCNGGTGLVLYRGETKIAGISVKRDSGGRITEGRVMRYDGRETNYIDVFDKCKTAEGLDERDREILPLHKRHFFFIEPYAPNGDSWAVLFYHPNWVERKRAIDIVRRLKDEMGLDHIKDFPLFFGCKDLGDDAESGDY